MDFSDVLECICPLLSIGQKKAVECRQECMLYKPDTSECVLSRIANVPQMSRFCTTSSVDEANRFTDAGWLQLATTAGNDPESGPQSLFVLGWPKGHGDPP